jgi:hypothetical protein
MVTHPACQQIVGMVRGRTVELDRDPGIEENRGGEVILTVWLDSCSMFYGV